MKTPMTRRRFGALTVLACLAPGVSRAEEEKQTPKPQVVAACGPLCALVLVLIILGVAVYMVVQLIKLCKKLQKTPEKPKNPNEQGPPPGPAIARLSAKTAAVPPGGPVLTMGDACPPSLDISDWAAQEGQDGVPNSPFHDASGFPYCVEFRFSVHAAETLTGPWAPAYEVVGYVSFSSTAAMEWTGPDTGGAYTRFGQFPPQNIRLNWFKPGNNQLAAVTYGPVADQQQLAMPPELVTGPSKFFRMAYQQ